MKRAILLTAFLASTAFAQRTWVADPHPQKHATGLILPADWRSAAESVTFFEDVALPSSFDWRKVNPSGLSPIRDQGQCGSCWAFSMTASVEDALTLGKIPQALSQQYVVSCNTKGYSCDGGFFDAYDMYVDPGSVSADQFPYTAQDQSCKSNLRYGEKILQWAYVGNDSSVAATEDIKKAIYQYGPVSVAVSVDDAFSSYRSGVFNTCNDGSQINHAVNIVGWDDANGGYWIMRNSWGASWGESGYMRIKYNCSGIGTAASFVKFRIPPAPTSSPTPTFNPSPTPTWTPTPTFNPSPTPTWNPSPTVTPNGNTFNGEGLPVNTISSATVSSKLHVSGTTWTPSTVIAAARLQFLVKHAYIGDLVIDLVAPNGAKFNLFTGSAGGSIIQYDQDITGIVAGMIGAGEWRLDVTDRYPMDDGVLEKFVMTLSPR